MKKLLLFLWLAAALSATSWVAEQPQPGGFPLVDGGRSANLVVSPFDSKVVTIAARDLAADIERVTGRRPEVLDFTVAMDRPSVLIGTLGHHPVIDELVARGRLDVTALRGSWESFLIATVENVLPDVPPSLVIVGSDRRGTAYGAYEL